MKIKLTKYILAVLAITFALTSCSKNEDALATIASNKQEILSFKNSEEFLATLNKVDSMKSEERTVWEKSKGFKSFGSICDDFYASIDADKFKSKEEALSFISANSQYIQILNHSDSSKCCVTKEFSNPTRYLMNANEMYIIGSTAYKQFDEGCISTDIANISVLKMAKDINSLKSNPAFVVQNTSNKAPIQKSTNYNGVGNSFFDWDNKTTYATFRIEIYLDTKDGSIIINGITWTTRNTSCIIKNYKQSAGIFWSIQRYTTYNVNLWTAELNNASPVNYPYTRTNQIIDTYSVPWPPYQRVTGLQLLFPYFNSVTYSANNDEGCKVGHTY